MTWFKKLQGEWGYQLTQNQGFLVPELRIPDMHVHTLTGEHVATIANGLLVLHPPYTWDGCTGIGRIIETEGTLRASLLHDFLYQLAEQPNYSITYTQRQADKALLRYLPLWSKALWYTGVRLFGRFFFGDMNPSLTITLNP